MFTAHWEFFECGDDSKCNQLLGLWQLFAILSKFHEAGEVSQAKPGQKAEERIMKRVCRVFLCRLDPHTMLKEEKRH